jgi:cytochrome c oxidase cbb3-type subunit 4
MPEGYAILDSLWTLLLLVVFLGIVIWAWNSKRKKSFDEASRLPLADDEPKIGRKTDE